MRSYRSIRVAQYHPPYRPYGSPPPEPKYQVVRAFPPDCTCVNHLAIVGEGPGADEDQAGFPFVGRSGEELDRFLDTYRIDPDECVITNIGRLYRVGNPDPDDEQITTFEPLLHEELNCAKPWWIAAVGRIATRYFLGDVDMEFVHGIPFLISLPWLDNGRGGRVVVVPVYHPAAGFHNTEIQGLIAYDFAQLSATLNGQLTPQVIGERDHYPDPDYIDLDDSDESIMVIDRILDRDADLAIDTEGLPGRPWGLSFSNKPGEAFVIRKVHQRALRHFADRLIAKLLLKLFIVLLHNSLHDLRVLRELGIFIPSGCFIDTMVLAYHLCVEPQGLKPLSFRHAGMHMSSYDEIVHDANARIALEYYKLMEALAGTPDTVIKQQRLHIAFDEDGNELRHWYKTVSGGSKIIPGTPSQFPAIEPYEVLVRDEATGRLTARVKKPQQIQQRVRKAMNEIAEGKITAADLRKRWNGTDDLVVDLVESVIGEMREADLDDVPLPVAIHYAARDADATKRIAPILIEKHRSMGLTMTGEIDHAIIPMVDEMQAAGMPIDRPYLQWLSIDLQRRMIEVQEKIKAEFGVWINPNSGDQVADLLFGEYGLIPTKQTKGTVDKETGEVKNRRGSTVDKVLEGMRNEHPIIPLIMEYRGLLKAKTSFVDVAIRKAVNEHMAVDWDEQGRPTRFEDMWVVHCLFRITRVSSGRLSATGPNLLAVMGGELGKEIRKGYIAGKGFQFATWDLNQIEMRVMASEADDAFLIDMFIADEDVHTGTADRMFHLGLQRPFNKKQLKDIKLPSGVSPRDPAKRTGFGVITGIQAPGLVDQMRLQGIIISEEEAAQWIMDWLAACPAVPEYMQRCHREAMAHGYVRDWAGRIRYLPGIHSPFKHIKAEAGRQSHSHKIQAGAQSIMKRGMATIHKEIIPYWRERGKFIVPVLQVHDEQMLRIRGFNQQEFEELDVQIRAAMFSAAPSGMKVPLDAGNGVADNWGELEK